MSTSEGGIASASGKITIDTSQAEKAPAAMAGVAQGIERALAPLDAATKKVQESIKLTAIEAQKAVNEAKSTQNQITTIVRGDTNERLILARAEAGERISYARAIAGELIEVMRQETNGLKAAHQTAEREARQSFTKQIQDSRQFHQAKMQDSRQSFQVDQQTSRQSFTKQMQDTRQFFQAQQQTARQSHQQQMQDTRQFFQAAQQTSRQSYGSQMQVSRQSFQAAQQASRQNHQAGQLISRQAFQAQQSATSQFHQSQLQAGRQFASVQLLNQRQSGQAQTQLHQLNLAQQAQANRVANMQQAQANRIQMQQMRQQSGGGGGGLGGILGTLGGAAGGIGGQIFQTLGAVATLDLGAITGEVIQLGVQIAKTGIEAAISGEKIATTFQRQQLAGLELAGTYAKLNVMIETYIKASGGAVSQSEALSEVVRLNALGFATSADQVKRFVTAARGISVAMGRGVQDVTTDLALAIGNMSTRRLDQLGLSVTEVNKRILDLREATQGLSRQEAFEQAVLGLSTAKFGDLAQSVEAQASPLERMTTSWENFSLVLGQVVKPSVDAVAGSFDGVIEAATRAAEAIRKHQQENMTLPRTPGDYQYGSSEETAPLSALEPLKKRYDEYVKTYRTMLDAHEGNATEITALLDHYTGLLKGIDTSISRLKSTLLLASHDLPQGAPDIQGGVQRPTTFAEVSQESPELFVDNLRKSNAIAEKALQDAFEEQTSYEDAVARSEKQFHQQLSEQNEDYQRKRARDEQAFQDDLAKAAREAEERETKARRDFDQQVAKEQRDNGRQQERWLRDYNQSLAKNNKDEKEAEGKANDDLGEKNRKDKEDSDKKLQDIEEKYQDDRKKAVKDHNESLADAAAHLDAAAVYEEQRRYARETKDAAEAHDKSVAEEKQNLADRQKENQKSHDDAIGELQKNNADRNKEEKDAYDQRVSDANEALQQQIDDQKTALNQQLEDARTADGQRLEDMKTAHNNQKTQEETDYGLQLTREKTHHGNELTELDNQHNLRMTQISDQALAERDALQTEFEAQLAEQGLASVKYLKAEEAFKNSALAIGQKWWNDQLGIMKGVAPGTDTTISPAEQSQINLLAREMGDMSDRLANATDPADIASINDSINMLYEALNLLDPLTYPQNRKPGGSIDPASISAAGWTNLDTGTSGNGAIMGAGLGGASTVTMGDVTIVLGDIGNRSNQDVKNMIGEALVEWVEAAAKQPARSRW